MMQYLGYGLMALGVLVAAFGDILSGGVLGVAGVALHFLIGH